MAYTRVYTNRINWQNYPSVSTPIDEINLNKMDYALSQIDGTLADWDNSKANTSALNTTNQNVSNLQTTKANQSDLLASIKTVDYNTTTGEFVFTWWNGTTKSIDLNIEKIPVSFSMSTQGVITMTTSDGSTYTADVGALIKTYTFDDSDTIDFTVTTDVSGNKTVVAIVKNGSITESKLQPNFLADVRQEVTKAEAAEQAAETAQGIAEDSAEDAEAWAVGQRNGVDVPSTDPAYHNNSKYWSQQSNPTLFANLQDVDMTGVQDGNVPVYDANQQKYVPGQGGGTSVPDMTNSTKGIGRPDGITSDVTNGVFRAKGVGIVGDVNPNGTAYGSDWLYYSGTTTVITPDAESMYRVIVDTKASLYYWNGTGYVQLASAGGSGGTGNLVDVTTAQYNALTPTEKADPDTWYWINDMDGLSGSAIVIGTFAGLTDTSFSNLQNGQIPVYNSTIQKWENQNISIPSVDTVKFYRNTVELPYYSITLEANAEDRRNTLLRSLTDTDGIKWDAIDVSLSYLFEDLTRKYFPEKVSIRTFGTRMLATGGIYVEVYIKNLTSSAVTINHVCLNCLYVPRDSILNTLP